jgi:hypothetical protein
VFSSRLGGVHCHKVPRRWVLHHDGFLGVVVSVSLVSLSVLDHVGGLDVYMCADCERELQRCFIAVAVLLYRYTTVLPQFNRTTSGTRVDVAIFPFVFLPMVFQDYSLVFLLMYQ